MPPFFYRCSSMMYKTLQKIYLKFKDIVFYIQRDFLKTRFSHCMLYRHKPRLEQIETCFFWDNSLYLRVKKENSNSIPFFQYFLFKNMYVPLKHNYPFLIFVFLFIRGYSAKIYKGHLKKKSLFCILYSRF